MADIAIFRINYKSDFILTLESDAGWTTPFCIKFWTGDPSRSYFIGWDGKDFINCKVDETDANKLIVLFDDHNLPIGQLKMQMAWHTTIADFPYARFDEVMNQMDVVTTIEGEEKHVELAFEGETAPEIAFSLPAYANEAQRIANEEARIQNEETRISAEQVRQQNETQRIAREQARQNNESQRIEREQARQTNESQRIEREQARQTNEELRIEREQARQSNEEQRIANETERVIEFAEIKTEAVAATNAANAAASLANEKAQLADDKAQLADSAASLATAKAQLAQEKATYAQTQGDYAKAQGDYAKAQGDTAQADHVRAEADHTTAAADHTTAVSDHTQAATDHATATSDHTQAGSDHTRAESDHTRAESDHAAVEVYVDSLGAFDISAYHATGGVLAKYADLTAALGTNGANIPDALRKGGMSVKFVQSSDNNYVKFFCTADDFTTDVTKWQGVDDEPTAGSNNLVKSGGVQNELNQLEQDVKIAFEAEDILSQVSSSFVEHKYPSYWNGSITTSGNTNPIGYYIIPLSLLQNYFYVRAYLQCDGSAPAAIAFYSSEESLTANTYLGGVEHKNTNGDWFEAKVPANAKCCLVTNRATGSVVPKILVLKKEKIAKDVYDIESFVKPTTYTETLLGTVEITSTTGNLTINCRQNEIIKLVIDSNCKRVRVGSSNYGDNITKGLTAGIHYIQLNRSVSKIYFYIIRINTSESGTIQVYKCSNKELFNYNPLVQSFYKYKDAGTFDTSKMTLGYQWNINYNDKNATASDATTGLIQAYNPKLKITLSDTTNYKFAIVSYSTISPKTPAGYDGQDSGWKTGFDDTLICNSFAITLRKNNGAITQEDLSVLSIEFVEPYVEYYVTQKEIEDYVENEKEEILKSLNPIGSINNSLNVAKPYYYHFSPDSFIKDGNGNNAIPSQTSFDIEIAPRLGFTFIEANIHSTSDGNFICMHGSAGKFGNTVYSLDSTDISNVAINTKTLSWIKENVRFNSYYDKYKVAPLSLEEFCKCCKVNGIGIFAGTDEIDAINLCLRILGTDNVMLYGAQSSKRSYFKGMMFVWNNDPSISVSSIINKAREYGIPFMYGLGPDLLNALVTNSNLNSLCTQMHQEGFTVASTAVYDTEENTLNAFEAGVDFSASGHQVNPFDSADVVYDLNDSSAFSGTGTIENGIASLTNGETIICGDDNTVPLGKGMLTIKFNGSLTVNFGSVGSRTLTSDGTKEVVISDYFFMRKAKMVITATSSTMITDLVYKTKKC